jgi:hypothetical protein
MPAGPSGGQRHSQLAHRGRVQEPAVDQHRRRQRRRRPRGNAGSEERPERMADQGVDRDSATRERLGDGREIRASRADTWPQEDPGRVQGSPLPNRQALDQPSLYQRSLLQDPPVLRLPVQAVDRRR